VGWIGRIWRFIVRFGRRIVVFVVGFSLIVLGIILIPLPGPGWAVVFAGLAVLSTEFTWAERLLHWAKHHGGTAVRLAVRRIKGLERIPFLRRYAETVEHELTEDDESDQGESPEAPASERQQSQALSS
jgi:hypothetical protein